MAKTKPNAELTQEWHDSVIDDTPDKKFIPKKTKLAEEETPEEETPEEETPEEETPEEETPEEETPARDEPDYEKPIELKIIPVMAWVDDWTQLKEVIKTNKEFRGNGNSKKWTTVFYGELRV